MKQITEDFVSYETAVLLKEKGFDEPYCNCYLLLDEGGYTEVEMSDECHQGERYDSESSSWKFGILLLRPTHQLALKWLREVHKLHIYAKPYWPQGDMRNKMSWQGFIVDLNTINGDSQCYADSYEEAIENRIIFVLENLI